MDNRHTYLLRFTQHNCRMYKTDGSMGAEATEMFLNSHLQHGLARYRIIRKKIAGKNICIYIYMRGVMAKFFKCVD